MKRVPLEVHPDADNEYLEAIWWYREKNAAAAERFVKAIHNSFEKIEESPERWPVYRSKFRKYQVYDLPYSIVYRIHPRVFSY